ncbi:MAG: hypothetical protein PHP44_13015 [Kiritimatiellae bacterium]|nr:hypothetical protein [Kiritimatiellia bacterium]MDD4737013.1 hypothetical protein [Kiritimatiellia bacterium]
MKHSLPLFILILTMGLTSGCATRQEAKMNQYGVVQRRETKLFLGFIPVLERDISSADIPME